jgi:outer membrane cobalamin receptor
VLWATGQYVGHRYTDPENTAAGRLDPYALVAIGGGVHVGGPVTLRVRVENLLDENYRTRPEFRHAGRAVYGGVQAGF